MAERLQTVLAHAGVASRRAAERLIAAGRVRVNGAPVAQMGLQVEPGRDRIEVDGQPVRPAGPSTAGHAHTYLLLHKPRDVVSTAYDPQGRPTVLDLVSADRRLYPVGRLDRDSEGLILLTDDGALTLRLTHARYGVEKEYHAFVACHPREEQLARLRQGVVLEDGPARAVRADVLELQPAGAWVRVVMHEGRKREVRRLLAAVGCPAVRLRRVRLGPLRLGSLPEGAHRTLSVREVVALRQAAGLPGLEPGPGSAPPPARAGGAAAAADPRPRARPRSEPSPSPAGAGGRAPGPGERPGRGLRSGPRNGTGSRPGPAAPGVARA